MKRRQRAVDLTELDEFELAPSKTEQKKAMQRMQQLGEQLTQLSPGAVKKLPFSERLIIAIQDYQRFESHEARRRQSQLLAKLLRHEDEATIMAALMPRLNAKVQVQLQRWMSRLVEQGDQVVAEFARTFKMTDRHVLRQHVLRVQHARSQQQPTLSAIHSGSGAHSGVASPKNEPATAPDPAVQSAEKELLHYLQQMSILSEKNG